MSLMHSIKRNIYSAILGLNSYRHQFPSNTSLPKIYYAGARSGNRGGPQVKLQLLRQLFPENKVKFNMLYLLSGSLYIPDYAINRLKDRGVKVILNQNGVFYPAWSPDVWEKKNKKMAGVLFQSDHIFYQSEFCKLCADKFLTQPKGTYEILYNGVDTSLFKPIPRKWKENRPFQFLLSGNISSSTFYRLENALDGLVEARKGGLNVDIKFSGILSTYAKDKINYLIEQKNMASYFKIGEPYSREIAPSVIADADAYLMTKHNDPCPNAVLEALACGLPVLYSSSGGVPELVGNDAGVGMQVEHSFEESFVPTSLQIAEGMERIIKNHSAFSSKARERAVSLFDVKIWAERHRRIFSKLINEG
jgi:glycosyltransferase involved in cell wall biosynthesis